MFRYVKQAAFVVFLGAMVVSGAQTADQEPRPKTISKVHAIGVGCSAITVGLNTWIRGLATSIKAKPKTTVDNVLYLITIGSTTGQIVGAVSAVMFCYGLYQ